MPHSETITIPRKRYETLKLAERMLDKLIPFAEESGYQKCIEDAESIARSVQDEKLMGLIQLLKK